MSIPQLRKSFHAVESFLSTKLQRGTEKTEDIVKSFRKEWERHFRKSLSVNAARSYINHMREKKQRGGSSGGGSGSQLMGAPLDHTTQPGVYGPYGNFLDYVNKGFHVAVPEPGIQQECGVKDITPVITTSISQRAGGRRSSRQTRRTKRNQRGGLNPLTGAPFAAEFRPFVAQNPVTFQASLQNSFKAMPAPPSGDPADPAFTYKMSPFMGKIPGANIAGLDRDLLKDVSVPY